MGKGPLVRVEIGPGRYGMMHRQDAIEAGLIAAPKRRKPADDFVIIRGIGPATVEILHERGIDTFEQLRAADVSDLPGRVRQAIEDWRAE